MNKDLKLKSTTSTTAKEEAGFNSLVSPCRVNCHGKAHSRFIGYRGRGQCNNKGLVIGR